MSWGKTAPLNRQVHLPGPIISSVNPYNGLQGAREDARQVRPLSIACLRRLLVIPSVVYAAR
jgi:hypothetical protein